MTQSVDEILAQRATTHGEYADHAQVTQDTLDLWMKSPNWAGLPAIIKETLHMTAHKVGRVLTGNPFLRDHFDDIAGYSRLISQRINADQTGLADEYVRPRPEPRDVPEEPDTDEQQSALLLMPEDIGKDFQTRDGRRACNLQQHDNAVYRFKCRLRDVGPLTFTERGRFHTADEHGADLVRRLPDLLLTASDVGKRFRTRNGSVATITQHNEYKGLYPFEMRVGDRHTMQIAGSGMYWNPGLQHGLDLVARID